MGTPSVALADPQVPIGACSEKNLKSAGHQPWSGYLDEPCQRAVEGQTRGPVPPLIIPANPGTVGGGRALARAACPPGYPQLARLAESSVDIPRRRGPSHTLLPGCLADSLTSALASFASDGQGRSGAKAQ